jgi:hypothetical protein
MASNWIRVDATIGRDARLLRARRILNVSVPAMVGMQVLLEAELLAQHPSGIVADVDPTTIAEWAGWEGDVVKLSTALAELTDDEGRLIGWDERHAVLIHRMERDADRKRQAREAQALARQQQEEARRASEGRPQDGVKTSSRRPGATERNGTERNGTTPLTENGGSLDGERPPASLSRLSTKQLRDALPAGCQAFVFEFYGTTELRRQRDVLEQLYHLASGTSIDYKGARVFAYSRDRLEAKCLAVVHSRGDARPRSPDLAIAVLCTKLGDTSDDPPTPGRREAEQLDRAPSDLEKQFSDQVLSNLPSTLSKPAK